MNLNLGFQNRWDRASYIPGTRNALGHGNCPAPETIWSRACARYLKYMVAGITEKSCPTP